MQLNYRTFAIGSGITWLAIGTMLLIKGLGLFVDGTKPEQLLVASYPWMESLGATLGSMENGAIVLIALALMVGFAKSKMVLAKTAMRMVARFKHIHNPTLAQIYPPKYYIIIGSMISLGVLFNVLDMPRDIRGFVDVAVGSALINGAMAYFRESFAITPVQQD